MVRQIWTTSLGVISACNGVFSALQTLTLLLEVKIDK